MLRSIFLLSAFVVAKTELHAAPNLRTYALFSCSDMLSMTLNFSGKLKRLESLIQNAHFPESIDAVVAAELPAGALESLISDPDEDVRELFLRPEEHPDFKNPESTMVLLKIPEKMHRYRQLRDLMTYIAPAPFTVTEIEAIQIEGQILTVTRISARSEGAYALTYEGYGRKVRLEFHPSAINGLYHMRYTEKGMLQPALDRVAPPELMVNKIKAATRLALDPNKHSTIDSAEEALRSALSPEELTAFLEWNHIVVPGLLLRPMAFTEPGYQSDKSYMISLPARAADGPFGDFTAFLALGHLGLHEISYARVSGEPGLFRLKSQIGPRVSGDFVFFLESTSEKKKLLMHLIPSSLPGFYGLRYVESLNR